MAVKLTPAGRRYLARAVYRLDHPTKRGTWERIRGGRSGRTLRELDRLGLIRLLVDEDLTDRNLTVFEIEATPAGRAALEAKED